MRAGSLFTGVGGFDMALEAAGISVVWQVEKDEDCQTVLRHHWPHVDLHEDVRNVGSANLAPVDLIAGGFPCQDVSVAGRRAGLAGERSGLFHEFMRVVAELTPRWVLIENVGGLLSSNGGRDMGTVLGTLGQLGYWWTYRCLDTQYFGPPQRRLRVFVVGHLGAPCPPEVLLEPESLPGHSAPRRQAWKGVARSAAGGSGGEGGVSFPITAREGKGPASGADSGNIVANTLPTKYRGDPHEGTDTIVAGTLEARTDAGGFPGTDGACSGRVVAHTLRSEGADASEDGTGRGTLIVLTQNGSDIQVNHDRTGAITAGIARGTSGPIAFDTTQVTSPGNYSNPRPGAPSHPLAAGAHPPTITPTIVSNGDAHSGFRDERGVIAQSLAIRGRDGIPSAEVGSDGKANALLTPSGGRAGVGVGAVLTAVPRRLTPVECERLQGWADDWTRWGLTEAGKRVEMSDSARYRMAGNGITAPVAEWIAARILAAHRGAS